VVLVKISVETLIKKGYRPFIIILEADTDLMTIMVMFMFKWQVHLILETLKDMGSGCTTSTGGRSLENEDWENRMKQRLGSKEWSQV